MKANERMILTYINKFKKVDFTFFADEFGISQMIILDMLVQLISDEYISFCEDELVLTEKGLKEVYESCNKIFLEEENIPKFDWRALYIPQNFEEIL